MDEESDKIAALVESLDRRDKKEMRRAAEALIAYGKTAPLLADKLHALMETAPAEIRWPIAYVAAQIAPLTPACLDALKIALDVPDPDIRWAIVVLLADLGKQSPAGVAEALAELVRSGSSTQRRMAIYCLRDIGARDALALDALRGALGDDDPLVRVAAATSLKTFPEIAGAQTDALLRLLSDRDSRVRASAAMALAHADPPSAKIRRALEDASRGDDPKLVKAARAALEILNKKGPPLPEKSAGPGD
jgi:HEAT repeat protein